MISDEEKDQVRAASDLVAIVQETVELKPRGHEFWGCCPFHGEKTPSFHIIPATQVWHCFGCGEGGDVFTYIMKRENLSFPESIRYLADRAGIELHDTGSHRERGTKRARIYDLCAETAQFYHTMLMRGKDSRPREYFASRGMGGDVCRRYCLGFAPGRNALVSHLSQAGFTPQEMIDANVAVSRGRGQLADRFYDRVMFPIFDEQGHNIAFGGRIMGDGQPKYLNTAETSVFHKKRNLYGFNWAKEFIVAQDTAIVVEGYTDCIACWEAGIKNVVATLGTALTEHHVKTLTRFAKRIVYMFDGDAAGQKAARRAIQFIEQDSMDLRCVVLPDGNDPMEFITAHGGEALQARIDAAEPLMDFVYRSLQESSDITTPGGRAKALEDALTLIYPLRDSYMIDTYFIQIADLLGLDLDTVRSSSGRVFRDVAKREDAERRREQNYERQRAQAERAGSAGGRASGSQGTSRGAWASGATPPVSTPVEEEPYDYVPLEAYGAAPVEVVDDMPPIDVPVGMDGTSPVADATDASAAPTMPIVLTDLERKSLAGERELLTMLTSYPDLFRTYADRICSIEWVDPRHESIAWAVLATPPGTDPTACMDAARAVCPEAASLVSAGRISSTSKHPTETNIVFMLDTLELYTIKRRMRAAQAKLRQDRSLDDEARRVLTMQAMQDSQRQRELQKSIGGVADPFRLIGLETAGADQV